MKQLKQAFVISLWLFCCCILWSPLAGTRQCGPRIGPDIQRVGYGFADYYTVTYAEGRRSGQFNRDGLLLTVGGTVFSALLCLRCWP